MTRRHRVRDNRRLLAARTRDSSAFQAYLQKNKNDKDTEPRRADDPDRVKSGLDQPNADHPAKQNWKPKEDAQNPFQVSH